MADHLAISAPPPLSLLSDFGGVQEALQFKATGRQSSNDDGFVHPSKVNVADMFDSVFGPEDQHNWGGGFLIAQIAKVVGISLASLLYNVALSSSSGATRERIQALGFYFDSQVIAEFLLFHATLVWLYLAGRVALSFFLYGPAYSLDKMFDKSFREMATDVLGQEAIAINAVSTPLEGMSASAALLAFGALAQAFLGLERGETLEDRRRRRRRSARFGEQRLEHLLEENFRRILETLEGDKDEKGLLGQLQFY